MSLLVLMFGGFLPDRLWLWYHRRHGEVRTGLSVGLRDVSARGWLCRGCGAVR